MAGFLNHQHYEFSQRVNPIYIYPLETGANLAALRLTNARPWFFSVLPSLDAWIQLVDVMWDRIMEDFHDGGNIHIGWKSLPSRERSHTHQTGGLENYLQLYALSGGYVNFLEGTLSPIIMVQWIIALNERKRSYWRYTHFPLPWLWEEG